MQTFLVLRFNFFFSFACASSTSTSSSVNDQYKIGIGVVWLLCVNQYRFIGLRTKWNRRQWWRWCWQCETILWILMIASFSDLFLFIYSFFYCVSFIFRFVGLWTRKELRNKMQKLWSSFSHFFLIVVVYSFFFAFCRFVLIQFLLLAFPWWHIA